MDQPRPPAPTFVSLFLQAVLIVADDYGAILVCCLKAALAAAVVQLLAAPAVQAVDPRLDMLAQGLAVLLFAPSVLLGMRDKRLGEAHAVRCDVLAVFSRRGARMFADLLALFALSMLAGGLAQELLLRAGLDVELLVHGAALACLFSVLPGYMVHVLVIGRGGAGINASFMVRVNTALAAVALGLPLLALQSVLWAQLPSGPPVVEAGARLGTLAPACLLFASPYALLLALETISRAVSASEEESAGEETGEE